jgi:hypothetical protein
LRFEDLCEPWPGQALPYLDRAGGEREASTPTRKQWREQGYLILPALVPDELADPYIDTWLRHNEVEAQRPGGYPFSTPYRDVPELEAIACYSKLHDVLADLIGEPMGVHLNLTGWISTDRNWHQDGYLNPDPVADHYAAVWIALEDIRPDSGPFQYVPGTHRWPVIRQEKMLAALEPEQRSDPRWPKYSEEVLSPLFEAKFAEEGMEPVTFLPSKGDVLIWHARLAHRGSEAVVPGTRRRALICHYSGIHHRPDMPPAVQSAHGGWLFPLDEGGKCELSRTVPPPDAPRPRGRRVGLWSRLTSRFSSAG